MKVRESKQKNVKKGILIILTGFLVFNFNLVYASDALSWLEGHKNPDGSFGYKSYTRDTVIATLALKNAGHDINNASDWLVKNQLNGIWRGRSDTEVTAVALLALKDILPENITNQSIIFLQDTLKKGSNVEDISWAVIALSELNVSTSDGVSYLISAQNSDGGFGYTKGGQSYTWETALAVLALHKAGNVNETENAVDWIEKHQYSDGSWGYVSDTALAVKVLSDAGGNQTIIDNGRDFLNDIQYSDGSYFEEYSSPSISLTALVLWAMPNNDNATVWLSSIQNLGEGWGTEDLVYETSKAVSALSETGINNNDSISWLQSQDIDTVSKASNVILTDGEFNYSSLVDYINSSQNSDGGFGYSTGFESNPLDTAYSLMALQSLGYNIDLGMQYLLSSQASDGSWNEDVITTAVVLDALEDIYKGNETNNSKEYLLSRVNEDGSWDGSVIETSLAIHALAEKTPQKSYEWVINAQNLDGGYGLKMGYPSDILSTSTAVGKVVIVDTTPPTYSNLTPQNNSNTSDSGQDISIIITDDGSDINAGSLSMTVAGNYYDTNSGKLSYDINSGLLTYHAAGGEFTDGLIVDVIARARDNAGNLLEVIWNFIVDLISPITILSPPNATITDTTPDLTLTVGEPSSITYSWDGEGNITGCQNCTTYSTTYGEATPDANTAVLLMHFNENTGYLAYDDSKNQNNGTINGGGGVVWTTGRFGNALSFNSSDDFVKVPNSNSLDVDEITIEVLVYPDYITYPTDSGHAFISRVQSYSFGFDEGTGNLGIWLYNGSYDKKHSSLAQIPLKNWSHVTFTYKYPVVKLYLNGEEVYSGEQTSVNFKTAYPTRVGRCIYNGMSWNGTIDEVYILDRALNATEIVAAYNKSLKDGQHSVMVYANDSNGNTNSTTRWFIVDTTQTTFNITLLEGWNLISLPQVPENTSITAVLASIDGNYTAVYAWIDGSWRWSTALFNPLTGMDLEHGYWINMTAPGTLELSGTVPASTTINVSTGWNLVGYPSLTSENLTTVLSPINYTAVYAWIDGSWKWSTALFNPLTEMSPGYGYWINATEDGSYEVGN